MGISNYSAANLSKLILLIVVSFSCQAHGQTVQLAPPAKVVQLAPPTQITQPSSAAQTAPPAPSVTTPAPTAQPVQNTAGLSDEAISKKIMDKLTSGKGDIVLRSSDLSDPKPTQKAKPVTPPPKVVAKTETPLAEQAKTLEAKVSSKPAKKAEHLAHWSYDHPDFGPNNWAHLDRQNLLCSAGKQQSPSDLVGGIPVDLPELKFEYKPSMLTIEDNGHTVMAHYKEGSHLILEGRQYRLTQVHFHSPSEDAVDGKRAEMVAHLVHQHADGKMLVVAILINGEQRLLDPLASPYNRMLSRAKENAFFQNILNHVPLEKKQVVSLPNTTIDINQLLPNQMAYFTYMGSLTTPPCSEGILWVVMKEAVHFSREQVDSFLKIYPNNARPLQDRQKRLIKESR